MHESRLGLFPGSPRQPAGRARCCWPRRSRRARGLCGCRWSCAAHWSRPTPPSCCGPPARWAGRPTPRCRPAPTTGCCWRTWRGNWREEEEAMKHWRLRTACASLEQRSALPPMQHITHHSYWVAPPCMNDMKPTPLGPHRWFSVSHFEQTRETFMSPRLEPLWFYCGGKKRNEENIQHQYFCFQEEFLKVVDPFTKKTGTTTRAWSQITTNSILILLIMKWAT